MTSPWLTFEDAVTEAPAGVWPSSADTNIALVGSIDVPVWVYGMGEVMALAGSIDVPFDPTAVLTAGALLRLFGDVRVPHDIEATGIDPEGEVALVGSMEAEVALGMGTIDENPLDNAVLTMVVPTREVGTGMAVIRWSLFDGDVTYVFEINPRTMDSPWADIAVAASSTTAGAVLLTEGTFQPALLKVQGAILTKEHYDAMVDWKNKRRRIILTDHFQRQMTVFITSFKPSPRRDLDRYWKHDYEMSFLVLTEPVLVAAQ